MSKKSTRLVAATDRIFSVYGSDAVGYADFVKESVMAGSMISSDISPAYNDRIVTLSTCSDKDNRFVVNAVMRLH